MELYANTPVIGNKDLQNQATEYKRILKKMYDMQLIFSYFINAGWCYQQILMDQIDQRLSAEDRQLFPVDIR